MSKDCQVYVIADTHFGHKKILEFEGALRPFRTVAEHDRELVARWNAVVRPRDTVWHLGDVFFGDGWQCLEALNGIKKLVLGNHDHHPVELYLRYFRRVFGVAQYDGCVLSHVPVHPAQFSRYRKNVHGHTHSNKLEDPRYVCVSCEQIECRPVLLRGLTSS